MQDVTNTVGESLYQLVARVNEIASLDVNDDRWNPFSVSAEFVAETYRPDMTAPGAGEPCQDRQARIAMALLDHRSPVTPELLSAGLLHGALTDTPVTFPQLEDAVGERIAADVKAVAFGPFPPRTNRTDRMRMDRLKVMGLPADLQDLRLAHSLVTLRSAMQSGNGIGKITAKDARLMKDCVKAARFGEETVLIRELDRLVRSVLEQ